MSNREEKKKLKRTREGKRNTKNRKHSFKIQCQSTCEALHEAINSIPNNEKKNSEHHLSFILRLGQSRSVETNFSGRKLQGIHVY